MKLILIASIVAYAAATYPEDTWIDSTGGGACTNAADAKAWGKHGKDFEADMTTCGKKCWGASACVTTCIEGIDGYSAGCAGCFGALGGCTKTNCLFKCAGGNSPSCTACVKSNCDPAFITCSGVTPKAGATVKAAATWMDMTAGPSGSYTGTATVLGQAVTLTASTTDGKTMELKSASPLARFDCKGEAYSYDASTGAIAVPGASKSGDCISKNLGKVKGSLKSVTYAAGDDTITIVLKVERFVTLHVNMKKVKIEEVEPLVEGLEDANETIYNVDYPAGECGEMSMPEAQAKFPVMFAHFKVGKCASVGYTKANGTKQECHLGHCAQVHLFGKPK